MSLEQLEQQIERLPSGDLVRLAEWFNGFLASRLAADSTSEPEWRETPELMAELERRLADFAANPVLAAPFKPDFFDALKRRIEDERAPKTSAR